MINMGERFGWHIFGGAVALAILLSPMMSGAVFAQSSNLPPAVQADLMMKKLELLTAKLEPTEAEHKEILSILDTIKGTGITPPVELLYIEARSAIALGDVPRGRKVLTDFLGQGAKSKFYDAGLELWTRSEGKFAAYDKRIADEERRRQKAEQERIKQEQDRLKKEREVRQARLKKEAEEKQKRDVENAKIAEFQPYLDVLNAAVQRFPTKAHTNTVQTDHHRNIALGPSAVYVVSPPLSRKKSKTMRSHRTLSIINDDGSTRVLSFEDQFSMKLRTTRMTVMPHADGSASVCVYAKKIYANHLSNSRIGDSWDDFEGFLNKNGLYRRKPRGNVHWPDGVRYIIKLNASHQVTSVFSVDGYLTKNRGNIPQYTAYMSKFRDMPNAACAADGKGRVYFKDNYIKTLIILDGQQARVAPWPNHKVHDVIKNWGDHRTLEDGVIFTFDQVNFKPGLLRMTGDGQTSKMSYIDRQNMFIEKSGNRALHVHEPHNSRTRYWSIVDLRTGNEERIGGTWQKLMPIFDTQPPWRTLQNSGAMLRGDEIFVPVSIGTTKRQSWVNRVLSENTGLKGRFIARYHMPSEKLTLYKLPKEFEQIFNKRLYSFNDDGILYANSDGKRKGYAYFLRWPNPT